MKDRMKVEDGGKRKGRKTMRTLGIILIAIGIILRIIKTVSLGFSWALILIGLILLLAGYLIKTKSS